MSTCKHCQRSIVQDTNGRWIDPEATDDDSIWRETCDEHDAFDATHEPCTDHTWRETRDGLIQGRVAYVRVCQTCGTVGTVRFTR